MENKTFIIEYSLNNFTKKMKVKRCLDKLHAELKLNEYIKKNNPDTDFRIINIEEQDNTIDYLSNLFGLKK